MKLHVYSVFDKAVGAFLPPFYVRSAGEAVRSFADACNDAGSNFAKHSLDFYLVRLGEWDDSNAMFGCGEPQRVVSAVECIGDRGTGEVVDSVASRGASLGSDGVRKG